MEDLMKSLPKEAQKAIEEVPALQEIIEPEPQGFGGTEIAVIAVIVSGALGLLLRAKCKCKK